MAEAGIKTCCHCKQDKPTTEFHKNVRAKDGLRAQCRACTKKINRASVLRHHEKRKAEKRAEYQRKKDSPEYKAYVKAYQAETKDKKREYDREYRRKNAGRYREQSREWVRRNPEKRAAVVRCYTAKRRSWTKSGVGAAELAQWTAEQPKRCYWCGCGCKRNYHVDHYVPLSQGGSHTIDNLVIACGPCNLRKNAKDPLVYAREVGRLF